eukprot:13591091-Alexandrium_andersonii.AAC.1
MDCKILGYSSHLRPVLGTVSRPAILGSIRTPRSSSLRRRPTLRLVAHKCQSPLACREPGRWRFGAANPVD